MKPRRLCYRVEHRDYGTGPFVGGAWSGVVAYSDYPGRMPCPESDKVKRGGGHRPGWSFAFPSLKALGYWCGPSALRSAHARDFVCSVYGAPWNGHVLFDEQISFSRSESVLVRQISLMSIATELEVQRQRQMAARISSMMKQSISLVLPDSRGVMRSWSLAA